MSCLQMDVFNVAFNRSLIQSFSNTNLRVCIRETLKFNSEVVMWFLEEVEFIHARGFKMEGMHRKISEQKECAWKTQPENPVK